MKRKRILICSILAVTLASTGCDNDSSVEVPEYTTNNPAVPDPNNLSEVEEQSDEEQEFEQHGVVNRDTDVLSADQPVMANAKYTDIQFEQGKATLSDEAEQELNELKDSLDENADVYLTVRVVDEDTIEATEPRPSIENLAQPRYEAIKEYLEKENVNISKSALDEAGVVANEGEDNAMARPELEERDDNYELVVVRMREQ